MAVQLILLQATELNLVARPIAGYSPQVIHEEFDIPEEFEVYIMIVVGYEADINELDEKLQEKSRALRTRNPVAMNFFLNKFE